MNVSVHHHYDLYPTLGLVAAIGVVILLYQAAKFTFWYMRMRLHDDAVPDIFRFASRLGRDRSSRIWPVGPGAVDSANHKESPK